MALFHVNPHTGEAGKCRAQSSEYCPFGGESDHHETIEAARAAYEASASEESGTFTTLQADPGRIPLRKREELARTSTDQAVLMKLAEVKGVRARKIAKALAENPAVSEPVLLEAAHQPLPAWVEFARLELHPNFPRSRRSGHALNEMERLGWSKDAIRAEVTAPDASGDLIWTASMLEKGGLNFAARGDLGVTEALSSPSNGLSEDQIGNLVHNDRERLLAAAKSGRYPSMKDIAGTSSYYSDSERKRTGVSLEQLSLAASVSPDGEKQAAIYDRLRTTPYGEACGRALLDSPHLPDELKGRVEADLNEWGKFQQAR